MQEGAPQKSPEQINQQQFMRMQFSVLKDLTEKFPKEAQERHLPTEIAQILQFSPAFREWREIHMPKELSEAWEREATEEDAQLVEETQQKFLVWYEEIKRSFPPALWDEFESAVKNEDEDGAYRLWKQHLH